MGDIYYFVPTRGNKIALTFDDGPSSATINILDKLRAFGCKATFFALGRMIGIDRRADIVRRIVDEGHEIAVHGMVHKSETWASSAESFASVSDTVRIIRDCCGVSPKFFRPPFGCLTPQALMAARRENLSSVGWSIHIKEWTCVGSMSRSVGWFWQQARPGCMFLLHDDDRSHVAKHVDALLDILIPEMRRRGLVFSTVGDLIDEWDDDAAFRMGTGRILGFRHQVTAQLRHPGRLSIGMSVLPDIPMIGTEFSIRLVRRGRVLDERKVAAGRLDSMATWPAKTNFPVPRRSRNLTLSISDGLDAIGVKV